MQDIKIIMSDVDGTILTDQSVVSPRTIEAIKKARSQGILFGLASGRDIESSESLFKDWGIEGLVDIFVGENGAHIKDYRTGIDEKSYIMDRDLVKSIFDHYQDLPVNFMIVVNGRFLLLSKDDFEIYIKLIGKVPYKFVSIDEMLENEIGKIHLLCRSNIMPLVIERDKSFSHPKAIGVRTADNVFEYFDSEVSKSMGLRRIIEMDHLSLNNLLVFGDADNDISMLRESKVGVVMGNGTPLAKSVANYITEDNNHDGIAVFLEKYILKQ